MPAARPATTDDLARLARTIARAFVDDPVMRWFFPDDDEYEPLMPLVADAMLRRWLATDTLWCTDDGVAVAGWSPPGRPEVRVDPAPIEHPAWRLARFVAIRAALGEHTPPEPHWYLNLLATHPDWQRQGLGGVLMAAVFSLADDAGLPCYLETETATNVAYYGHHGFAVRSEWDLVAADGARGPHMWGMYRAAR